MFQLYVKLVFSLYTLYYEYKQSMKYIHNTSAFAGAAKNSFKFDFCAVVAAAAVAATAPVS